MFVCEWFWLHNNAAKNFVFILNAFLGGINFVNKSSGR